MKARIYDPATCRFLSPDPNIQAPEMSLNYNRYAYCMNNPLSYIDPSGETWFSDFFSWLKNDVWYGFWDLINGKPDPDTGEMKGGIAQVFRDLNIPAFEAGYNTSQGSFHSIGSNNRVYHNQVNVDYSQIVDNAIANVQFAAAFSKSINTPFRKAMPVPSMLKPIVSIPMLIVSIPIPVVSIPLNDMMISGDAATNSGGTYSIDNAVAAMNKNSKGSWTNVKKWECATYLRYGIEAGFGMTKDKLKGYTTDATGYAKTMGPYLVKLGFQIESITDGNYQIGDIAIIQSYKDGGKAGHAQMYNGSIWVSDFDQEVDFWPGGGYRTNEPSFVIYRWKK